MSHLHSNHRPAAQDKYAKPGDLFHTLHKCGHSVYWRDAWRALVLAPYPCPRCGGASGKAIAEGVNVLSGGPDIVGLLDIPDGATALCPVTIHHMVGGVCCRAAPVTTMKASTTRGEQ